MTLEIQVGQIITATIGWNVGGGPNNELWQKLGTASDEKPPRVWWQIERETQIATNATGQHIRTAPFMGVMGMPPSAEGIHATFPPRFTGGNIDCKLLTPGSKLYLPIAVEGGLFSTGDGHAAQGDGEVSGTAIECAIEQVDMTFTLHTDLHLTTPRAETSAGKVTFGFHEDLDEATYIALNAMLDWLMALYDLTREQALSLASVVVDMRITQIVNGVKGVHALLPHGAVW
jgi:acetamidase/formamidase